MSGVLVYFIQMSIKVFAPKLSLLILIIENANTPLCQMSGQLLNWSAILACE